MRFAGTQARFHFRVICGQDPRAVFEPGGSAEIRVLRRLIPEPLKLGPRGLTTIRSKTRSSMKTIRTESALQNSNSDAKWRAEDGKKIHYLCIEGHAAIGLVRWRL